MDPVLYIHTVLNGIIVAKLELPLYAKQNVKFWNIICNAVCIADFIICNAVEFWNIICNAVCITDLKVIIILLRRIC